MTKSTLWRPMVGPFAGRLALFALVLGGSFSPRFAAAQERTTEIQVKATDVQKNGVIRETVLFPGWDPYEPVPAYVYRKPKADKLPVVIFIHGMGANKSWQADWHRELAE